MSDIAWLDDEENGDCRVRFDNGMVVVTADATDGWYPRAIRDDANLTLIESKLTDLETAKHRSFELWALLDELIAEDAEDNEVNS